MPSSCVPSSLVKHAATSASVIPHHRGLRALMMRHRHHHHHPFSSCSPPRVRRIPTLMMLGAKPPLFPHRPSGEAPRCLHAPDSCHPRIRHSSVTFAKALRRIGGSTSSVCCRSIDFPTNSSSSSSSSRSNADFRIRPQYHNSNNPFSFTSAESSGMMRRPGRRAVAVQAQRQPSASMDDANEVVQRVFGFEGLNRGQEQVIEEVLSGGSAVAIFPTGGGKSLCYQVPSLLLEGLTVVVSPLIALMKEQVAFLKARGVAAEGLDSTLTAAESAEVKRAVRAGECRLLYVSPERFTNEAFLSMIKQCDVALFAVDEAHCISEWGHSFRPDYLRLARFSRECGAKSVLALTATATQRVAADITESFQIPPVGVFRTPFHRPNLELRFSPISEEEEEVGTRDEELLKRVGALPSGAAIVYASQQRMTEAVAEMLQQGGVEARAYHAGMASENRDAVQEWFMSAPSPVVVATIAFGMGIDRADIRSVIHYTMPRSLEGYSQEIGRAGRDGKPSVCEMLPCSSDIRLLSSYVYSETPSLSGIRGLMSEVWGPGGDARVPGDVISVSLYDQGREWDIRDTVLRVIYAGMDISGGYLHELTPYFSVYQFEEIGGFSMAAFEGFQADAIKAHMKPKRKWTWLDLEEASGSSGVDTAVLASALGKLEDEGKIRIKASKVRSRFRVETVPSDVEELSRGVFRRLLGREEAEVRRIWDVVGLVRAGRCQTGVLLERFGGPGEALERCGHCEWCLQEDGDGASSSFAQEEEEKQQSGIGGGIDGAKWEAVKAAADLPRGCSRLLARFACGMFSPHISSKGLSKHKLYGSMADHDFRAVLKACQEICDDGDESI